MKRFFSLLFLASFPLHALYFGNPASPDIIEEGLIFCYENWAGVKVGYQGDYCFNRNLKAEGSVRGRIDDFSYLMNQGVFTFNILDRYEFYGSLGAMNVSFSNRSQRDFKKRNYETNGHFTWGAGARLELFHWGCTLFSVDGAYQYSNLPLKWNALDGASFKTHAQLKYVEWQVGGGVSHQIDMLIPYAALTYSSVQARLKNIEKNILHHSHFSMRSNQRFGLAMGCTISSSSTLDLNAEVRLFSEQAISLAGNIKF